MDKHVRPRALALSSPLARARAWLGLLAFALPVALVAGTIAFTLRREPALASEGFLFVLALVGASSALMWWWLDRRIGRVGATLGEAHLHVECGIGRGTFALADLATHGLRTIDFDNQPEYRPRLRTWGIGLPGLSSGWFRLRNGDKALCILTDRRRACMLRAPDATRILLSLADPLPLREALERARTRASA
jgi:hypothetical protein